MAESKIKFGVSMYSFTCEFYAGRFSLEDMMAKIAEIGGKGFECVAASNVPNYPWPTQQYIDQFIRLAQKYRLQPVSYGAYIDKKLRHDREMTEPEIIRSTVNDIEYAHRFGFQVMRTQHLITPAILEKIIPYAEAYNIKVGVEVHIPHLLKTPTIQGYINMLKRVNSPFIGLIPDFGIFMERPNKFYIEYAVKKGANEKIFLHIADCQYRGIQKEAVVEEVKKMGGNAVDLEMVSEIYTKMSYGPADTATLADIMPHVFYMHGKFYYINEGLEDPSIAYHKILPVIRDSGYDGYIMTEYEGHLFGGFVADPVEMCKRHIQMEHKILGLS